MKQYKIIFSAIHAIYRLMTTSYNIDNFLLGICRIYKNTFNANRIIIIVRNLNTGRYIKVFIDKNKQYIKKGNNILTKKENNMLKREKEIFSENELIYPFVFSEPMGVIYIKKKDNLKFQELERRWFLSLCEVTSICLKIFNLYNESKKTMISYINSLTKLLNQYVPTSYINKESIFYLTKVLGKEMKLAKEEIKSLEYALLLHDAGKIQLPSKLLKKQRTLTDEEFKIIKEHPYKGVELIKDLEALKPVIPIILHHHEKYDGSGYPYGLKKDEIPFGSRFLAVLDAFDAMFFGRPYKKRKYLDTIIQEFELQKGKQFDPDIVDAFLKILKRPSVRKRLISFLEIWLRSNYTFLILKREILKGDK